MSGDIKTARVTWKGSGLAFKATAGSGFSLHFDNPAGPRGGSPMEVVAMAAAGCAGADVIDILRKKQQDVTGFEVNVRAHRSEKHPKVFTRIELEFVVRGRNVNPKAVARSIELSLTKYCSVNSMLGRSAKITSRYRIEEEESVAA